MQNMVDEVHAIMWDFCQSHSLDVDPVQLKRSIQRHLSGALQVVSPECLSRLGARRLSLMINTAGSFDVTLAEVLNESLVEGSERSATLCQSVKSRKVSTHRMVSRPQLSLVK
jgi:hypothetical protein